MHRRTSAIIALILLILLAAGCASGPETPSKDTEASTSKTAKSPVITAAAQFNPKELTVAREQALEFYAAWVAGIEKNQSPEEMSQANSALITDKLAKSISNPTDYDKVLCAQNTPSAPVRAGTKASYAPATQTISMDLVVPFGGTSSVTVEVEMIASDDVWKINKINCPDS